MNKRIIREQMIRNGSRVRIVTSRGGITVSPNIALYIRFS